ncbi:MAG TPA: hypothetical protein VE999_19705 [Gemmataceae bacterium]|nr:hypothetical protein [Gemmataceae bacterium]
MGKLRLALSLVFLLALAPGCQVLYRYRPVPVLVRDAETKKPIASANIHISYPLSRDSLAPFDSSEHTGPDGIAHLRAAPYGDFGIRVDASAAGYLPEQVNVSTESIQHVTPPHPFEETERRKPEVIVEMYSEPRFTVELVVPTGYRGIIKAEVDLQDDVAAPPGQRSFSYEVVDGFVRIKGPGVLRRIYPSDYRARYTDGTPLSGEMTLSKNGFRWLRGNGKEQSFFVGTQTEYDMERRFAPDEQAGSGRRTSDSAPSNGRGGRHRRFN